VIAFVPIEPGREQARAWAVQELSRREYQEARPGLIERALTWLWDRLNLLDLGTGAPPTLGLVAIVLIVAGVVWYAIRRSGGLHRVARRPTAEVLPAEHTTAADHRAAADRHAAAGRWDLAVVERFRAVAREFEEQALLDPQPGRTALEVARAGGRARPDLATALLRAAGSFDDVSYGHLAVGAAADEGLRALDDRLRNGAGPGIGTAGSVGTVGTAATPR
jgi:Domain of unknown function (DUF4129)